MFPGMGGMNPKKMQAMMKQLGINQDEIDANRVIIECDDKNIIIEDPSVTKVNMQGQENFQISGEISETEPTSSRESNSEETNAIQNQEPEEDKTEEDIKTIIEKTGVSEEEAKKALEDSKGDLTEALLNLS
jgi:nascent polypeptide-associated complex subunit alpha